MSGKTGFAGAALVFPRATAALVRQHVGRDRFAVAVDGGLDAMRAAEVPPHVVVGDLDSVSEEAVRWAQAQGAAVERHPRDKRDPDGALALARVAGHADILFLGAGGGRLDHALANLHLLHLAGLHARARLVDVDVEAWVVTPERPLELSLPEGAVVSVLPLGAEASGVRYDGLAYPLEDAVMVAGDPYGVSNVARTPPQRVRVGRGALLVIHPRRA